MKHHNQQVYLQKQQSAQELKALGDEFATNNDYANAIKMYTMALEIDKNDERIWHNRSLVHYKIQKYQQSLRDANQAIKLNHKYIKAYIRAIQACLQLSKIEECKMLIEKTEQLDHQNEDLVKLKNQLVFLEKIGLPSPFNQLRDQFFSWLGQKNSIFDKITIYLENQNNRSVRAKRKIAKKQIFLFIPKQQLITLEMTRYNKTVIKILEKKLELISPKHCLLSIYLLDIKLSGNSKFQKYIELLPKSYENFPIFYRADQLEQLRGSYFFQQVNQKMIDIEKDYNNIVALDPQNFKFTFEQFCWARMTVCSRVFGISIHDTKTDVLVPLADMLNHRALKQTIWYYSNQREGFVIESLEQIQLGVEVFDSYGKKCNSRFLLNYGFILQNNDSNQVTIKVEMDLKQLNLKKKMEMTGEDNYLFVFRMTKSIQDKKFNQFVKTCRFITATTPSQIKLLQNLIAEQINFKPYKTPFISFENQRKCWGKVYDVIYKHLQLFPTNQQQDEEILKNPNLSYNRRNCILLRKGEKQILNYFLKYCQKMNNIFEMPKKNIKKILLEPDYKDLISFIIPLTNVFK